MLIFLQDWRPNCGSDHEDQCYECDESHADHREVRPTDAPHVHHGEGDCPVHQGGAEVRLQEYERSRGEAETEVAHRALPVRAAPSAIDDEPGKRKH